MDKTTTQQQPPQRFVVTAWRNREELLQVRHDLYSSDSVRRERALNQVFAWRVRKPNGLPLLLDSSADIVDVVVQDEKGQLQHNALRLLYAAAISRFVTGLADTQIELIRDRPSWFPPGKSLQLPPDLLEIRHRIVHRHLPTLTELKRAARASLDWLWEWYWSQLDHAFGLVKNEKEEEVPIETARENLSAVLKTYVKGRKNEIKARQKDAKDAADTALLSYRLAFAGDGTSSVSARIQRLLLKLLVDDKMILPTDRKLGSNMSGAFLIWDPFLTTLCMSEDETCTISTLLKQLLQAMNISSMYQATIKNREMDPVREGMHDWLIHILSSDGWKPVRGEEHESGVVEDVLTTCFSEPTYWNLKLAAGLLDTGSIQNQKQWKAILAAATSEDQMEIDSHEEVGAEERGDVVTEQDSTKSDSQDKGVEMEAVSQEKLSGPRKVVGLWKPRPIGWIVGLDKDD